MFPCKSGNESEFCGRVYIQLAIFSNNIATFLPFIDVLREILQKQPGRDPFLRSW